MCPRDPNYSDSNRAFDGDFNTAWVCTRAKNQDGQQLQVDFGRQVTITQIRVIGGFDATAPDGTDQWSKHRIVTKLEVYFPKDLRRDPVTIDTGGARDWRFISPEPSRHGQQTPDPRRRDLRTAPAANSDKRNRITKSRTR